MANTFVHLHLHSEYSLIDGLVRVKPLVSRVADAGMPAVAVTDQCNLFALVKFYRAAIAAGVKPIVGVDLRLQDITLARPARLVLLCQDHQGYLNLTRLISMAYLRGQSQGAPYIQREWLHGHSGGLIALSGGHEGDVGQALLAGKGELAARYLSEWEQLFPGRYYLQLQRTGRVPEEDYLHAVVELAMKSGAPVVASNDVRFLRREDFEAHEARVCIHDGRTLHDPRRPRLYSDQQYLRTPEEMSALFEDIPEALENTVEIARRCNLELTLGENVLPEFPVPEGMTTTRYFTQQVREGLEQRLTVILGSDDEDQEEKRRSYHERLDHELEVINNMGFPGYFLIVADFIRWARENDVPVGPGRGSGAGSLVAYALGITNLDPLAYDLLFERFLNPERVSLPDFDVDFCMDGRDRVIEYVAERYGRERVAQIITYGTMAAKAVVRDVGRVLGNPYGFVDQIAKLIPFDLGITLDKALEQEEQLRRRYEEEEDVHALIELARSLEGLARNAGKHAGGVVIAPSALTDFTPLYCEQGSTAPVTQLDKDDIEAVGLVKFDFLGLRTLTIIDWAVKTINRQLADRGGPPVDIDAIPLDDEATYELLKSSQTTAVFQLESRGMKDLIKRQQPDCFEDIIALVALFRPGPLQSGMVDDFIDRKHGRARVNYPHPELEPILKPTYGVILYQEQVMQIAQVLAGYTLGQADLLRRAMGKKKPEEMAKQRSIFLEGAEGRGVEREQAAYIFDLMEKFAGYGFNKSHSAAYALIAYQTAWLKAHYPAAFMAAVLSSDMDNTDKIVMFMDECRCMGLAVEPPNINRCDYVFTVSDDDTILYGLGAIKGVGAAALDGILEERRRHGEFRDLLDLCKRIDLRKANRRVLEALIRCGALDVFDDNRARTMALLGKTLQMAERHLRDQAAGQSDLFGAAMGPAPDGAVQCRVEIPDIQPWSEEQRLLGEKETLGLYLTGHPVARYEKELAAFITARIKDLNPRREQRVVIAGLIVAMRAMNTKRGERFAFVTLDDGTGRLELAVFAEAYRSYRDHLVKDRLIVVEGTASADEYTGGFRIGVEKIFDINQAREIFAKRLEIDLGRRPVEKSVSHTLVEILAPFREGDCPVWINCTNNTARASLALGREWQVHPTDELLHRLEEMAEAEDVRVVY